MSQKITPDELAKSGSVDGLLWADCFAEHFAGHCVSDDPDLPVERVNTDTLLGWFANAIENGKNHVRNNPERYDLAPAPSAGQEQHNPEAPR